MRSLFFSLLLFLSCASMLKGQELNARVLINREQVSNTKSGVFEALEKQITQFLNERSWTNLQFREQERIQCSFNITISTYSETDNSFKASLLVASTRPVWGSSYSTTVWNYNDKDFSFNFQEFDKLEWRPEQVDNNLTAMLAYWVYIIIGMDLDAMSPMGGTDYLRLALDICNNADGLGNDGWKAFGDTKNRFAIANDYLDGSMEKFRQLQYEYYRKGLDQMSEMGAWTACLVGRDGGRIGRESDYPIIVPCQVTARVQECHITIIHILCEMVENMLTNPERDE